MIEQNECKQQRRARREYSRQNRDHRVECCMSEKENATYCLKWAYMGPPLIEVTAWHRVGAEAVKSLDVLCCQSRCHMSQNSQESSCCIHSSNTRNCSNIVGGNVTMPQTAIKGTVDICVLYASLCQRESASVAPVDPNLALKGDQVNVIQLCIWISNV